MSQSPPLGESAIPGPERRCTPAFVLGAALLVGLWVAWIGHGLWHPDARVIFRDSKLIGLPNLQYIGEAVRERFIPWVNPRRGCGTPFLVDPQTQAMYPPAWAFALFPAETAFKLHQFAHLVLLGVGFALLARLRGVGVAGSLCAGFVAVSAQPNLAQIEWLPILAGVAWVPWTFLAAMTGSAGWWAVCLALMVYSGYAYLWVMAPVVVGAGILLAPRSRRRRFLLVALLLPAVVAPCWMGYFALTGDAKPHGMTGGDMLPVTGFEPWHLSLFLMPRGITPYGFYHADGHISYFPVQSEVAWSLACYFGVIPLILGLYAVLLPTRERPAILFTAGAGLAMAFGGGVLAKASIPVNHAIHHPATFIQLFVWALLLAWPVGWQMLDDPAGVGARRTPQRVWLWLGLAVAIAFGVHQHMSGLALEDGASTYWNHSFNVGWFGWLIAGIAALLAWGTARFRFAAAVLLVAALVDVLFFLPRVIPITDSGPSPVPITRGIEGEAGRLRLQKDFVDHILGTKYSRYSQKEAYLRWIPAVGHPNDFSRVGIHQFDDNNPPFIHVTLARWTERLDEASGTAGIETLRKLSGVRYIMTAIDMSALGWREVGTRTPPVGSWTARLYDAGPTSGAVMMSRADLSRLDAGGLPDPASFVPVDLRWHGQTATAALPTETARLRDPVLFVPVTAWLGWRPLLDGTRVEPVARDGQFGLAVSLPPGACAFELRYAQPWAAHALFAACAGILGVWFAARRRRI